MARKTASRLDKRREIEAAEAMESSEGGTKKKATRKKAAKKKTTRTKKATVTRKRLVWAVFSGSMKEEARFPYEEREAADAKVEQLRSKSKKLYFVQPVKETIDGPAPRPAAEEEMEAEAPPATEEEE